MDLSSVLEFDTLQPKFTLIESKSGADGSFLIHHLLSSCLRHQQQQQQQHNDSTIFFLTFSQTFSHYKSVQGKLGNSALIVKSLNDQKLVHFDTGTQLANNFYQQESNDKLLDQISNRIVDFVANRNSQDSSYYVIVDDLSIASLVGIKDPSLLRFFNTLNRIDSLNVIVYAQSFYSNSAFISDLVSISDLYLVSDILSTGYSKEINGQVSCEYLNFKAFFQES
jgi:hypothetical protein